MSDLQNEAIVAALANDWTRALEANLAILKDRPEDTEALNRLAYAYSRIGNFTRACTVYKQVLSLDKYNAIATKNLEKYLQKKRVKKTNGLNTILSPALFLEEPGKTKIMMLINVAPISILSNLSIGQLVLLTPKRFSIEVRDESKIYLGALPDDVSFRLKKLIDLGNKYSAFVKSVGKNSLTIFVKELFRSKKSKYLPAFSTPDDGQGSSFTPRPDVFSSDDGFGSSDSPEVDEE